MTPDSGSVKIIDIVKELKLFSYMQNYQSHEPGSVEQSRKISIPIPTKAGSCPMSTKLGVDILMGPALIPEILQYVA